MTLILIKRTNAFKQMKFKRLHNKNSLFKMKNKL
jgi:hypothetical protein